MIKSRYAQSYDLRGDHVGRASLLRLLISYTPCLDQVAYMSTLVAHFGIVAHAVVLFTRLSELLNAW